MRVPASCRRRKSLRSALIQPLASFAHTKLKRDFYEIYAHVVRGGRLRTPSPGILKIIDTDRPCCRCHFHVEHRDVWQLERQCKLDELAGDRGLPK